MQLDERSLSNLTHVPEEVALTINGVSRVLNLPVDSTTLLVCVLVALPLAWVMRFLPPTVKLWWSLLFGWAFGWLVLGPSHFFATLVVALLVQIVISSVTVATAPYLGPAVTCITLLAVSCGHVWRIVYPRSKWEWEFTLIAMTLTVKSIMTAYCVV
jgi:hypothetical protein